MRTQVRNNATALIIGAVALLALLVGAHAGYYFARYTQPVYCSQGEDGYPEPCEKQEGWDYRPVNAGWGEWYRR